MIYLAVIAAVAGGLIVLGALWRVFPGPVMVPVALVPVGLGAVVAFWPQWQPVLWAVDGALVVLALLDLSSLPRTSHFRARRLMQRVASLAKPHPVQLELENASGRTYTLFVRDDSHPQLQSQPEQFSLVLPGRSRAVLRYRLRARRRGAFEFQWVYLRLPSRWHLWQRFLALPVPGTLHVYPDMKQLDQYALLARTNRLALLGLRRTRRVGQDNEFERLRDYTPDDNYRHIDWRATARRRKLTVKEFQTNQSQTVIFLVDCGRMMVNRSSGLSLLDHAFNAVLMLSYVALEHGDRVGLMCFSDRIHSFVPPEGGQRQMNRLIHACFDRFPQLVESRYDEAFLYLQTHCRKRALVVLLTNLIDELNAQMLTDHLRAVARRHLPLAVLLRDPRLFEPLQPLEQSPGRFRSSVEFYRAAAAAEVVLWRHQVLATWHAHGVLYLDVFPDQLTAPLVNRYLEIKARHLL